MPLYPEDRLVLSGKPEQLVQAETFLALRDLEEDYAEEEQFGIAEIPLAADSPLIGRSLAQAKFRETYRVTAISIHRGEQQITSPAKDEVLKSGDRLIITGKAAVVQELQKRGTL